MSPNAVHGDSRTGRGISLGPGWATLARMREADPAGCWRGYAGRLIEACKAAGSQFGGTSGGTASRYRRSPGREEATRGDGRVQLPLTGRRL